MISYGGFDLVKYAHREHRNLNWHPIINYSQHWELTMQKLDFLDQESGKSIKSTGFGKKIIADSGTSFFLMPEQDRKDFIKLIEQRLDIDCKLMQLPICTCPSEDKRKEWPDFRI